MNNYLVSYQHSGNTWVRYIVECLTQIPTIGHQHFTISERNNNFLNVDLTKDPILIKRHELLNNEISINDKFILLLRNYKDCIKTDQDIEIEFNRYINLVNQFEIFKGNKIVFYFEDLMNDVESFIINLFQFINISIDKSDITKFVMNYDYHKKQSYSIYSNRTHKDGIGNKIYELLNTDLFSYETIDRYR